MSVSSIATSSVVTSPQKPPASEAAESLRVAQDHDGDADDRSAPAPVVNTSGQVTGLVVNDKA